MGLVLGAVAISAVIMIMAVRGLRCRRNSDKKVKYSSPYFIVPIALLSLILCAVIGATAIVSGYLNKIDYDDGETLPTTDVIIEPEEDETAEVESNIDTTEIDKAIARHYEQGEMIHEANVMNILLIGRDTNDDSTYSRSDSMMIMSVNRRTKEIKLTSILRDIYVYIPGRGTEKLNHAHAYGGAPLLIETVESAFKIDIDKYVSVNFSTFKEVIDAIGGVEITLSDDEAKIVNGQTAGTYLLNGEEALKYSRIRKIDSDVHRAARQRNVITKIIQKVKSSNIGEITKMLDVLLPAVKTDFTRPELIGQAVNALSYASYDISEMSVPIDGSAYSAIVKSLWVWVIDFEDNTREMQNFIYGYNTVDSSAEGYE